MPFFGRILGKAKGFGALCLISLVLSRRSLSPTWFQELLQTRHLLESQDGPWASDTTKPFPRIQWSVNHLGRCLHKAVKFRILLSTYPCILSFILKYFYILTKLGCVKPSFWWMTLGHGQCFWPTACRYSGRKETYRKKRFTEKKTSIL